VFCGLPRTRGAAPTPYPVACDDLSPEIDDELQLTVEGTLGEYASGFGIVVQELTTGARAEVNPQQSFFGASLYKTAVMYEVLRQVEEVALSLEQYVMIDSHHASKDLGTLGVFGWGAGSVITIYQALEAAITISDNATAFLLGDLVGWPQVDITLHDIGATDTQFSQDGLPTTAGDTAMILQAIACADGVSDESSQLMLDLLAGQMVNNRLPLYLPDDAVIGHKTGNWVDANHDAGIVYGPDAVYLIAVLSHYPGADDRIARLSREVYEHFNPEIVVDHNDDIQPR
jgi:beta-lactamase class A